MVSYCPDAEDKFSSEMHSSEEDKYFIIWCLPDPDFKAHRASLCTFKMMDPVVPDSQSVTV